MVYRTRENHRRKVGGRTRANTYQLRYFKCPVCHSDMFAPKIKSTFSGKEHKKDMYCYVCKQMRTFIMDNGEVLRVV